MESQHVKSINLDSRSNKRIKFASARERSKRASADVYRSHKRKIGATSAKTREEAVHNPGRNEGSKKRQRSHHLPVEDDSRALVLKSAADTKVKDEEPELELDASTTFASELDESLDRNVSEIFAKFHRKIWPLVRSLPEILHHTNKIIDILVSYMLSPAALPERPSEVVEGEESGHVVGFIVNHATADIFHLLSVLARDLRHEIHPFLHTKILPRILQDLLNPPPPPPESGKQPIPLDVSMVEAAFRCLSYIFRYDADSIVEDMEKMRQYYGKTLGARRELVRRLAAETFAPVIRKMASQNERHRHLKRVLKALMASETQQSTPQLKRTQADAVDGISQLLFELVRGVPGTLHSQGNASLRYICTYCTASLTKKETKEYSTLLQSIATTMVSKVCKHLNSKGKWVLTETLATIVDTSSKSILKKEIGFKQLSRALDVLQEAVTNLPESFLSDLTTGQAETLFDVLDHLFCTKFLQEVPKLGLVELLEQTCGIWSALQRQEGFTERLRRGLENIFKLGQTNSADMPYQAMSRVLANSLIPNLSDAASLQVVGSVTLVAASRFAAKDWREAILTVFSLVQKHADSTNREHDSKLRHKEFRLFSDGQEGYVVPESTKSALLDFCLVEGGLGKASPEVTIILRCIPFISMLSFQEESVKVRRDACERGMIWIVELLGKYPSSKAKDPQNDDVVKGLAMEAISVLMTEMGNVGTGASQILKLVKPAIEIANECIFSDSRSLWVVRGVAALAKALQAIGFFLNEKEDETFDELVPNLSCPSHFMRIHSLEILCTYPTKNFRTDHAELDLEGDLDEEPSYNPSGGDKKKGPVGRCELMSTLLKIEQMRIRLTEERPLLSLVSHVEVMGRDGRLPVSYTEAAAHHLVGLFYIKFAPLWPFAKNALVALAKAQEDYAWPALEKKLVEVIRTTSVAEDVNDDNTQHTDKDVFKHYNCCVKWGESLGSNLTLFGEGPLEVEDGEVLKHLSTDDFTAMESIWGIAEDLQQLVAKNSRVLVPTFISFLSTQFFKFHNDDPSARELELGPTNATDIQVARSSLSKFVLQRKLQCLLRCFAAVDGPQQMVQNKKLAEIYRCFLTHQETSIVGLSLSCLLKYKPKHLVPYKELLQGLLEKGRLRKALLDFQDVLDGDRIAKEHRALLIPVVSRLLFGRLTVRESRSSKDSPAARRAAILSFLSILCGEKDEFFPFIYLMTRNFVPRERALKEIEVYSTEEKEGTLAALLGARSIDMAMLPGPVIEGFLNLLQTIVAQLGHRIEVYIPHLTNVVLELCKLVAVKSENIEDSKNTGEIDNSLRRGPIRTLCYQRLSQLFSQFGRSLDFSRFGAQLWSSTSGAIELLPEMVMKTEKTPSLLSLLETISTEPSLFSLLRMHEEAVVAVVKCVSSTSLMSVMNTALSFLQNLLDGVDSDGHHPGHDLIAKHIPLLLKQFSGRLKSNDDAALETKRLHRNSKARLRPGTWRKELRILCQVSELITKEHEGHLNDMNAVLHDLCELLLPYLQPGQGTTDDDKMNVIEILKRTIPTLPRSSATAVFDSLSTTLMPVKAKASGDAISVRFEIASLICIVGRILPEIKKIASLVQKLSAVHTKRIDEVDFETAIPALNSLGKDHDSAWVKLGAADPLLLSPLVSVCFHFLHNEDGVLARASFNALKTLITVASENTTEDNNWSKTVESLIVPPTRSGIQSRDSSIRRYYVLIVREIAKRFSEHSTSNICGDLEVLIDEENPDLDFFMGITHVQIHRKGRAFQRLRKTLNESEEKGIEFSSQSLSSILLPLALHPAYECKTKAEESIALEGIATVGAIARLLPWNKYNNTLMSILTSFERNPEQERYLVATMCAMLDAFSYDLVSEDGMEVEGSNAGDGSRKSSVWRALERRIIPKVEALLTKEKTDRRGNRIKLIRPPIVLTLLKLFQKFPTEFFESKLPHILAVMCDALRSRESDARDVARTTMAKIATSLDRRYLADIVRELTITLNEGYKLHVRAAVIHTILHESLAIAGSEVRNGEKEPVARIDACVPALMDVLQEDLFGVANERRESQDTNVRYVKEAGGSKSVHSIEMICRLLVFKPSAASSGKVSQSSVHCVVSPLLERLRLPNIDAITIRKIKEILLRVVIGLAHNPTVVPEELFPFVYATVQPFIGSQLIASVLDEEEDEESDDIVVSGGKKAKKKEVKNKGKVVEWRPSTQKHAQSARAAVSIQKKEQEDLRKVVDGASAPKLTGTGRHGTLHMSSTYGLNDPATISAVVFGLNLLHASLKKMSSDVSSKAVSMMDPFVAILTVCICNCKDNDVALVAMKCVMSFLRFKLPSLSKCSKSLGAQALTFLSSSGSSLNQNHDMTQACFKTLTYLINHDELENDSSTPKANTLSGAEGEEVLAKGVSLPLNAEQMKVLLSLISVSIAESDQHNPALGLIKAILSRRFQSPEFYDLMETVLKLNVRSQKASLRHQSAGIFIRYLLDYPMGEERFQSHLKQVVANITYEYQDGRLSAIQMLSAVVEKLPQELLDKHAQTVFLPLVLQLVNDDAKECREAVSKTIMALLSRVSTEVLQSFHDYTWRWAQSAGPLQAASLQVYGLFVESSSDFIRSNSLAVTWMTHIASLLELPTLQSSEWEVPYFSLICVEKLCLDFEDVLGKQTELWKCIIERLIDDHPWIKLTSGRLLNRLFVSETTLMPLLEENPGLLFEITKNLCFQIDLQEAEQTEILSELAIKTLTTGLPIIKEHPELCFEKDSPHAGLRDPMNWVLRRLSQIAKPKGRRRRMAVYKAFAAFCTNHPDIVQPHYELLLEPLHRSNIEATNELENPNVLHKAHHEASSEAVLTEATLARDVLQLIEESCAEAPEKFLQAYAAVKSRARDKKDQRKTQAKAEAVQDPMAAAQRKIKKQVREKHRKKRRVEDRRRDRGAQKKRRSTD